MDPKRGEMRLSSIFRWYQGDFGGRWGVIAFLLQHLPDDENRRWLAARRDDVRFVYQPYDWSLNAKLQFQDTANETRM